MEKTSNTLSGRLLSLDFMRGFIMILLAIESTEFYYHVKEVITDHNNFGGKIISQFFHNPWRGLHFWDLIQPSFMFMAGIAMTYSLTRQVREGMLWNERLLKILKRSTLLLFWGLFKRISDPNWLALNELDVTDILTQLAFTTIIAFLLFDLKIKYQVLTCIGILLLTEVLYRYCNAPGFDRGYVDGHNFGDYVNWILFRQKTSGYVFINWLPTAVHTVAGTIVGKLLMQNKKPVNWLIVAGFVLIIVGYGLDITGITYIIKPIATSSFILTSLGFCLLILVLCYWWIDIRGHKKGLVFFQVFGMNSIFIYLFFDIVGRLWLNGYVVMIVNPVFKMVGFEPAGILILASLCTFAVEWGICYFLYKKKIFFKL